MSKHYQRICKCLTIRKGFVNVQTLLGKDWLAGLGSKRVLNSNLLSRGSLTAMSTLMCEHVFNNI